MRNQLSNSRKVSSVKMLLNKAKAKEEMSHHDLRALIATSPANVLYSSDLCPYGECFVLLPYENDEEPAIVVPISGVTPVVLLSPPWISDVRYYGEFYTTTRWSKEPLTDCERKLVKAQESWENTREADPIPILIRLLEERGITKRKIGVDESLLPPQHPFWQEIETKLPNLEVVYAHRIFRQIRAIKTDEEIRRMREAARITEKAWEIALEQTSEGMTEGEFARVYENTIVTEGGKISSWMNMYGSPIAFGRRTAFVDIAHPSAYKLKKGDIIRFDGGCGYMGYPCDMARTAVLGQPSEKLERIYDAILEGEQLAINMAKPGAMASAIFNAAIHEVRKRGVPHYERQHTGHGFGIEGSESPLISTNDHTELKDGMVLCLETPYYEVGWGGPMCEDVVVIRKDEPDYLTTFNRELYVIK